MLQILNAALPNISLHYSKEDVVCVDYIITLTPSSSIYKFLDTFDENMSSQNVCLYIFCSEMLIFL